MCGILGQIEREKQVDKNQFNTMLNTLKHRGPDGEGKWFSKDLKVAIGHRRLSFFDLSELGAQPMLSTDESIVLSFNGEIYNFLEIRNAIGNKYPFKSNTDSEVLIAAYLEWGIDFIAKLEGMFAFALYDMRLQKFFLVRDRFGIKPLYFVHQDERFLFASELKAIVTCSDVVKQIDVSAMMDYFVYRYIPSPKTIWKGIQKLKPAHYFVLDVNSFTSETKEYWKLEEGSTREGIEEFSADFSSKFCASVREHMKADVPVGSFLSGGYDSSAIAIIANENKEKPFKTFTVGFDQWEKSEDQFAHEICQQHGIDNEKIRLDDSSLNLIDLMPEVYDEPIADISIIPTYAVSKLASKSRKAVLSGEGADELFLGYHWQKEWIKGIQPKWKFWRPKKDVITHYCKSMAMGEFNSFELEKLFQKKHHNDLPSNPNWFYQSHFKENWSPVKALQYLDIKCFMGELVLTKIDRASMANSLEVRVPFLKHTFFEKVFKHDVSDYFIQDISKFPVHELLKGKVSKRILNRKKQGFVGPDSYYMNHTFYREAIGNSFLVKDGIISEDYIQNQLKEAYNWKLWKILVLEKWYTHWRTYITQ